MGAMRQPPSTPTPRSRSSRPATAKRRPRPPGRPTAGDGDRREHVLDAALACYLQRGIAATSLRDISRQAGVTPALLHYYFDAAAGLRDAVVAERVLPVFGQAQAVLLDMRDAPLRHFSRDRLFSVEARRQLVEPDLMRFEWATPDATSAPKL